MTNRKKHAWVFIICVLVLAALIFLKPSYGWRLQAWLGNREISQTGSEDLAAQNESLEARLAVLEKVAADIPANPHGEIRAMVLSQYPFGLKNELLVDAGSENGVAAGKAGTFQGIFIGSVSKVFVNTAVLDTIFNPGFKISVRIGSHGADALLVGGAYPKLTSLDKAAKVEEGDIIYTAAPGLPYGLPVATVVATSTSPDNLFEEASLSFAYNINDVETVLIAR